MYHKEDIKASRHKQLAPLVKVVQKSKNQRSTKSTTECSRYSVDASAQTWLRLVASIVHVAIEMGAHAASTGSVGRPGVNR